MHSIKSPSIKASEEIEVLQSTAAEIKSTAIGLAGRVANAFWLGNHQNQIDPDDDEFDVRRRPVKMPHHTSDFFASPARLVPPISAVPLGVSGNDSDGEKFGEEDNDDDDNDDGDDSDWDHSGISASCSTLELRRCAACQSSSDPGALTTCHSCGLVLHTYCVSATEEDEMPGPFADSLLRSLSSFTSSSLQAPATLLFPLTARPWGWGNQNLSTSPSPSQKRAPELALCRACSIASGPHALPTSQNPATTTAGATLDNPPKISPALANSQREIDPRHVHPVDNDFRLVHGQGNPTTQPNTPPPPATPTTINTTTTIANTTTNNNNYPLFVPASSSPSHRGIDSKIAQSAPPHLWREGILRVIWLRVWNARVRSS
jgi:hypothetical protein